MGFLSPGLRFPYNSLASASFIFLDSGSYRVPAICLEHWQHRPVPGCKFTPYLSQLLHFPFAITFSSLSHGQRVIAKDLSPQNLTFSARNILHRSSVISSPFNDGHDLSITLSHIAFRSSRRT